MKQLKQKTFGHKLKKFTTAVNLNSENSAIPSNFVAEHA